MQIPSPFPGLGEIIELIGEAGHRLAEIDASEGAAGNISVYIGWPADPRRRFPIEETLTLPEPLPELAGALFLVTGSGRRLREVQQDPEANIGAVRVDAGGQTARLYTSHRRLFTRLTSELNSHLAVHRQHILADQVNFHAIIHAQPVHLTYLTHVPGYQDEGALNRRVLRWQPELIVHLHDGIGYVPFSIPGSKQLMDATLEAMRQHRVIVWAKHGVMARSDASVKRACDLIEYAETGARYECLDLASGGKAQGLTPEEIRSVCEAFQITQCIY